MINIVYTSRPHDGLFYYSYEHFIYLKELGYDCELIIYPIENFTKQDYIDAIKFKYNKFNMPKFSISRGGVNLMMGRSLLIFADQNDPELKELMHNPLILVYNSNHPLERQEKIIQHFNPECVYNLCDTEAYINGIGENFIKSIHFNIYKEPIENVQFKYLFNGTNEKYYTTVTNFVKKYDIKDYRILVYRADCEFDLQAPVENILGIFDTYVYTKEVFDPAPRFIQECSYFNKKIIYQRKNLDIPDGGSVYYKRHKEGFDFNLINNITFKNLTNILELYE